MFIKRLYDHDLVFLVTEMYEEYLTSIKYINKSRKTHFIELCLIALVFLFICSRFYTSIFFATF